MFDNIDRYNDDELKALIARANDLLAERDFFGAQKSSRTAIQR